MILSIDSIETEPYDKEKGDRLPMFSRTGKTTKNLYKVFQTKEEEVKAETHSRDENLDANEILDDDKSNGQKDSNMSMINKKHKIDKHMRLISK
jgi:hypothetical protein